MSGTQLDIMTCTIFIDSNICRNDCLKETIATESRFSNDEQVDFSDGFSDTETLVDHAI